MIEMVPPNSHSDSFAKYAAPLFGMSRSIFTQANSARSLLISICSALTGLLSTPVSRPSRLALTQLNKVCFNSPRLRETAAMLCPDCTSRTASCLNFSV